MRNSWFIIVGLCAAAAIAAGCATDVGAFGPDSGTNNTNPDVVVATDMGAPIDNGPRPACNAELDPPQLCVRECPSGLAVRNCQTNGNWGACECFVPDAGTPDVPVQPACTPACSLDQTCRSGTCVSNCPRTCTGRETCILLASAGWSCVDLSPPVFACALNETQGCTCPGGSRSAQTCLADRTGYGPCQCVIDAGTTPDASVVVDVPVTPTDVPLACFAGSANCDNNVANGCEVNTTNSRTNCGSCGNTCPARANSIGLCNNSRCDLACTTGFANCNDTPSDGCETDMRTSLTSCGACGNACPARDNTTTTCSSGACGFTCLAGYADCDRNPFNGCEANLRTSESSCGVCGNACGVGSVCSNGVCQFACNAGDGGVPLTSCPGGATCISLSDNLGNCGACGRVCPANVQAHATCMNGACGNACNTGFGDCDRLVANGCERELVSDPVNCGACGTACPARANAATTCASSSCSFTCNTSFGDCNYYAADGCETDTRTNTLNCGGCGRACPSGQSCSDGRCVGPISPTCPAGRTDCRGYYTSGPVCVDLAVDRANCGACGYGCWNDEVCSSGRCNYCPFGQLACGNVCTDVRSNASNCGGCGITCSSGQACVFGVCTTPCTSGQIMCGGACTSTQTDTNNCGACGNVCPVRANVNGITCLGGACGYNFCNPGFGDCFNGVTDGCETVLNTNSNCGACGRICGSGTTCSAGACVSTTPVDAGTPDAGVMSDVMIAPVSCPPGFSPRNIEYRIPSTIPAGCGGSSARPVFWGQVMGEPISTGPGVVIEPVGTPVVPLYHAPLPGTGAPLTPLPLQFTDTAHWGPGNYFDMSARCGDRFGTYYESLGFWLPYANLAAAGGSFRVNGVEMASEVVRVGNKMRYILGPSCVPN